jgi:hypothetical protein
MFHLTDGGSGTLEIPLANLGHWVPEDLEAAFFANHDARLEFKLHLSLVSPSSIGLAPNIKSKGTSSSKDAY